MCKNDAYFISTATIRFPHEPKKLFERILRKLQYLHEKHPHHFTMDLDYLDRILENRYIPSGSFPVTAAELEYMFDTLDVLWLHHDSPPYLLYLLLKLADYPTYQIATAVTDYNYSMLSNQLLLGIRHGSHFNSSG